MSEDKMMDFFAPRTTRTFCTYRQNIKCRSPKSANIYNNCQLCLIGQLCDETSLNTRAFMDLTADRLENAVVEALEE